MWGFNASAQNELWVLNEFPPSLGVINMVTFDYEELITFSDASFATDLEIRGDEAFVVLENSVVKVDLLSGQILADTELLGAQEAALLEDGRVVVTRGGVDDAWQPLELNSHLVWLDGDDLNLVGELAPTEGPSMPSKELKIAAGKVYIAVNNAWTWGEEVGRMGCWDPIEGTYEEWDLGDDARTPWTMHVFEGDVFTVNNGDWTSTSVSRVAMADMSDVETVVLENVSAGCNASTFVDSKLAVQIAGELGLRVLNPAAMDWEEEVLNEGVPAVYSLIAHPEYGWTCAGVTDYATYGEVQIRTSGGDLLAAVPVGLAPGTLAWRNADPGCGGNVPDECGQCEADFDFGGAPWGVSPDPALGESFQTGVLNAPYEDVLHLKVPLNMSVLDENIDLELDSVEVVQDFFDTVDGTYYGVVFVDTATQEQFFANELGLTVTFNNNGSSPVPYIVLPDAQFCAAIEGVPTRAGFYRVKLDVAVWLNPFGAPFAQLFTFDNFRLNVLDASLGCTDMNACNYVEASTEEGSCVYAVEFYDCEGNCVNDADGDGVCDELEVFGCAYAGACNFMWFATEDDGSCLFVGDSCDDGDVATVNDTITENCECLGEFLLGCTNADACNFDPHATIDDGSCVDCLGCTEPGACNYNPIVTEDDGSCTYLCGCTDPNACNYDVTAVVDDGSCCVCVDAGPLPLLNQTWKFSSVAGAIAIGPNPGSTEWYASPADGLVGFQFDDRWQFYPDGTFVYDNNGSTMNPFDGYVETPMTVAPSTYTLELQAGPNGEDLFTVSGLTTEAAEICGWMGVWDSGPTYTITELTENRLVLSTLQQGGDCINPVGSGYFTLIFESEGLTFSDGGSDLGICLSGCTDPNACNHWELAEYEDGSCDYSCQGCTDPFALNFAEGATLDNGACLYVSCVDVGSSYWAEGFEAGLFTPPGDVLMHGIPFGSEWVVNLPSLITEPGSGQVFATEAWTDLSVSELPPGVVLDIPDSASVAGGGQLCIAASGIPEMPGTYMAEVTGTLIVSLFGSFLEIGVYSTLTQIEVLPNPNPIPGCTYPDAANYVPYADQDNGSCVYEGCADPLALNHYPFIAIDDGSCVYGELFDASCGADINQDGTVTSADLLALLSSFGQLCD